MTNPGRLHLGLLASVAVVALLGLVATAGSAKTLDFQGDAFGPDNQKQARFHFKVHIERHKLEYVHHFTAKKLDYTNETPPVPVGRPGGTLCHSATRIDKTILGTIDFQSSAPTEFTYFYAYPEPPAPPSYETRIFGKLHSKRHKGHRVWKARGTFIDAQSEGGLQYAGCSTGRVYWEARAVA